MGAYEVLWAREGTTFKRLADVFREQSEALGEVGAAAGKGVYPAGPFWILAKSYPRSRFRRR